jgi:hypothetical protein
MRAVSTDLSFRKLNEGWNAEPNAPEPVVEVSGSDTLLRFLLNPFIFPQFAPEDRGILRFRRFSRYRFGATNDEGWYRGQCRYSATAPKWGEFYELSGTDSRLDEPKDWKTAKQASGASRHFLFYFRDATFECIAADWIMEPTPHNALFNHFSAA